MNIYYRTDSDYLEVFLKENIENYADFESSGLMVFRAESNDEIIGYGLEDASKKIGLLLQPLYGLQRMAVLLRVARKRMDMTQENVANLLGITLRQYQRIENGENTKMDIVLKAKDIFPKTPLEVVLMGAEDISELLIA